MKLERWQARKVHEGLYPGLNYLQRLKERMVKVGFKYDDPLVQLVQAAYDAQHRLAVYVHYLSCEGVGRPSGEERPNVSPLGTWRTHAVFIRRKRRVQANHVRAAAPSLRRELPASA